MFDIGWTELLMIACVAIIVVGPKDLPRMLRSLGQTIGKMRRLSREFQSTFNDALREAEREADILDMKKQVEEIGNTNPLGDLKKSIEDDFKAKPRTSGTPDPAQPASKPAAPTGAASVSETPEVSKPEATKPAAASSAPAPGSAPDPAAAPVAEDNKA
ncbi:hypothetical protein GCM10011316_27870 [Roseibium aquae]|uniref:Sec-independent protein translocase protein TatB n=1 Tax=Roseibium aquae TaxID=1323746 RepID=A0A916X2L3_9HYPH|nr:Sec-independent protein translocase protein TatB [Roseibium aquae]GGB54257.1 hypothetical protein GCM10011316_27870 [Roseibium aquae]